MSNRDSAPLRVAIYARVSTDEQREGQTIDSQIAELQRFADERSWPVIETYKDEGWSGAVIARPALDQLRDDAAGSRFDAVIINDVDRLARDVTHLGVVKRDLERKGIQVIFRKLPVEQSPISNFMVNIFGSFAEFEREMIADRTRRGRRHKVEVRKEFVGCSPPYGYRYAKGSKDARGLSIHADEAALVLKIFQWVAEEALSMQRVADRLTAMHIPPRRGGRAWNITTVHKMLRNEMYAGVWWYFRKESIEPKHPRRSSIYRRRSKTSRKTRPKHEWARVDLPKELIIVPRALWTRVQHQIDRNPKLSPRNTKYEYLLQGLLTCGFCMANCGGSTCLGSATGRRYFYYQCWRRCQGWIRRDDLESAIWSEVEKLLLDPQRIQRAIEKTQQQLQQRPVADESQQRDEQQRLREDHLFLEYQQRRISSEALARELERIRSEFTREETSERTPLPSEHQIQQWISSLPGIIHERVPTPKFQARRMILRRILDEVIVKGDAVILRGRVDIAGDTASGRENLNAVISADCLPHLQGGQLPD